MALEERKVSETLWGGGWGINVEEFEVNKG